VVTGIMRFALLGDHLDGLAMARALIASGRHELVYFTGPAEAAQELERAGLQFKRIGDSEEVLADPAVEMVIVAGRPTTRPEQLRRALQSERHVLCVHPADVRPDIAYEAAMIQADTRQLLFPILPEALHPAFGRLDQLARGPTAELGQLRLIVSERWSPEESKDTRPSLPGWDVLRRLGGEIAEVSAFAASEELTLAEPVTLSGRFEDGGHFQCLLVPGQPERRWQLHVLGRAGSAELLIPQGWPGPARLTWRDAAGRVQEETWDAWDPWPVLVQAFEATVGKGENILTWQDEIRCLELDDAARRSVEKRRSSVMEYQEASEEVGFKGTMTLVGCGLLWGIVVLAILSAWFPGLGYLILPVLVVFLLLQILRWMIPASPGRRKE
jgi:predicted dehydrogenase